MSLTTLLLMAPLTYADPYEERVLGWIEAIESGDNEKHLSLTSKTAIKLLHELVLQLAEIHERNSRNH